MGERRRQIKTLRKPRQRQKTRLQQLRKNLKPRSRSKVPNSPNSLAIMTPTTRSPRYILYHDDAENWEGLSKKQKERYGKLKWQDRPEASSAPTAAEFKGVQVQKPYKGKDNAKNAKAQTRRRLVPMTPSEHVLTRRRLVDRPKSHCTVLETLLEEINRLN